MFGYMVMMTIDCFLSSHVFFSKYRCCLSSLNIASVSTEKYSYPSDIQKMAVEQVVEQAKLMAGQQ
ncbi:hypothetical protein [Mammaliicoccus sciuri]|nr:hypothetical protein [Mammaliicoccus sciuri]